MARRTTWLIDMGDGTWAGLLHGLPHRPVPRPQGRRRPRRRRPLLRTRHPPRPPAPAGLTTRPTSGPRCGGAIPDPTRGRTRRPPPTPLVKEQLVNPRIGWGQPPPGWAQPPSPGGRRWSTTAPAPSTTARSVGRWWWPTLTVAGFLAVVVQVLDHDDPAPGLSTRGLLTIALAAAVVALLTIHRRYGPRPLARALAEYTVVALLADPARHPRRRPRPAADPASPPRPARPSPRPRPRPATTSPPSSGPGPRSSEP